MIELEIDGKPVQVQEGSTVMDAANKLGIFIPHFCYHKKLSIAANCRMCLVQVEKAPKPLPACATPATAGMKAYTHSDLAVEAQKGVMEFLLINHPLDCPICDQGGECQLQDLAVGYGDSNSRYQEMKRVVSNKNLGALVATDMTRCIHCTRCVRFGQEVADMMELGMVGRGEHSEIMPFVERTVDSELSGNIIDLCPVGALTSKPFRYTARTWELVRRKSVSPHCGLGSNLVVQVKQNRVYRVLPRENEEINECWLSDKERFSYEGLNADDRLESPKIKQNGHWRECSWDEALEAVVQGLKRVRDAHGPQEIGALASPHSTLEELYLLQKLIRGLGSGNVDHRLRQADFRADSRLSGAPWLGQRIAAVSQLKSALVVGSTLRKDHPLLALRLRQAVKRGADLNIVNPVDDPLLVRVANKMIVAPGAMTEALVQILKAVAEATGKAPATEYDQRLSAAQATESARAIADSLLKHTPSSIFLGNMVQHHPSYSEIHSLAQEIVTLAGIGFGFLGEAANSVGGFIEGAVPMHGPLRAPALTGMDAAAMLAKPRKAYVLFGLEAELDTHDPVRTLKAMDAAEFVVAIGSYQHKAADYADVLLPAVPFTETSGTFLNTEGRAQCFNGVVRPRGDARPGWKILRVIAALLGLEGFKYESAEEVRAEMNISDGVDVGNQLDNRLSGPVVGSGPATMDGGMQRIGEVPAYHADPIVRRAESLQRTQDAEVSVAWMPGSLLQALRAGEGERVRLRGAGGEIILKAARDDGLPAGCVRVAAAHPVTVGLGPMFGEIHVEAV